MKAYWQTHKKLEQYINRTCECSNCHFAPSKLLYMTPFCPMCGARMENIPLPITDFRTVDKSVLYPWQKIDRDVYTLGEYIVHIDFGEYENHKQLYFVGARNYNDEDVDNVQSTGYDVIKRYLTLDEAMQYVEGLIEMEE